jgi:ribosomal protein S3AE
MAIAKKKKKFFDVEMPLINKETQLIAMDSSELDGKEIKYDLTRILKGKSILMNFKVKVQDEKLTSIPKELKLMPYYLRRMVRKGTDYVEDSFTINCKNAEILIKPFLITRRKVSRSVKNALRQEAKKELTKYCKPKSSEEVFEEILRNKLQKSLSLKLKKIYPLSLCEIRILKVVKETLDSEEPSKSKEEKTEKKTEKEEEKPKKEKSEDKKENTKE